MVLKKILIVEDEKPMRDLLAQILQEAGHEVDTAEDGEIGYTKMQEGGYDLVLLDIMLPKMDGLKIMQILEKTPPRQPITNIVILSNLGQVQAVADAVALGARGYMIKTDYTPDQIATEVNRYLE